MRMNNLKWLALLAVLALSLAFPFVVGDSTITSLAVDILLFCAAALAWNFFSGYTGYISLGHATYFGLGAYTMAIVCQDWNVQGGFLPFLILPLAGIVALFFAIPLGWIAVRAKGYVFIVLTIAIFYIFQTLASNLSAITGGSMGIFLPNPPWDGSFFDVPFYFVALVILLLALLIAWWIRASKYGLALLAIRDDEDRARGLGIKTHGYKLGAYILSAFFIGLVGALTVYYNGSVSPNASFSAKLDVVIALIAFLGGRGTVVGPLVGGVLLVPLQKFLIQQYGSTPLELVLYGGVLLVIILLLPEGIVPSLSKRWQTWMAARHRHGGREVLQTHALTAPEVYPQPVASAVFPSAGFVALQGIEIQNISPEQGYKQIARPLPLSSNNRHISLPTKTGPIQRVKSQRLMSIAYTESPLNSQARVAVPPLNSQAKAIDSPVVSWRCPSCRKPFLLKGNTCYCPRCGTIRCLS